MILRLGNATEHVTFDIPEKLSLEPSAPQYSWNAVNISVSAGPWVGSPITTSLLSNEMKDFLKLLSTVFRDLKGKATLDALEGWIKLDVEVDIRGGVRVNGSARDNNGARIEFEIKSDQTFFSSIPNQVEQYLAKQ